ncbi:cupin domain-containing protein [Synechococcus elongatus]|uniref:dTDP-4-dehydrorhamnose 3,5-epimerase n=1 Tax=Synechococcus elongatus (strain ATCC 33912 / PCC 7942 / FACHB-805) TaxID=1140 RepID=Q31S22_SYNE7|nr:cupin domain-containing protein [Synechococcus elongatus]ABB56147.1 conserved hypothetical protein [Synechococcus elongatus PCC 7942 = FACHB-805]AJD58851.1 hypothetical protein M744_02500 [Synechococcus elongatus UTEX 2973]MBD2587979.1 cupin domain-containing protein [Synechococcus elongatus FACHB-242]MBD2689047.1 cupin domain-containing protein [Synechococcus elongatus FACHB-1061]MBD2707313.1 cupin domain-containing protein [Synechococcus elongatus PCC 7942 = FACHB-805]
MALVRQVEVLPVESFRSGTAQFFAPQTCDQTMVVELGAEQVEDLFVHHFQTDQLMVLQGQFVLVVLENRRYRYLPLSDRKREVVRIPPGIPHGAVNLSGEPCLLVNAVIRHGEPCDRDYRPLQPPLPYDWAAIQQALQSLRSPRQPQPLPRQRNRDQGTSGHLAQSGASHS